MKRIIIISLLLFFQTQAFSQAPAIQWQQSFGGTLGDISTFIETTSDGGYITAGFSNSNDGDVAFHHGTTSTTDWWVIKFDNAGVIQWQKSLGGSGNDGLYCVKQTSDGGYILAGDSFSNDGDVSGHHGSLTYADVWIVKLNSTGSIQWQKSFGGTANDGALSVKETSDGNFVFVAVSYSNDGNVSGHNGTLSPFNGDMWIVKINSIGTILWQDSFGGSALDYGLDIIEADDGGFVASAMTESNDYDVIGNNGSADGWLVKLNSAGLIQWKYCFGGTAADFFENIKPTSDKGFIITGTTSSTNGDLMGTTSSGLSDVWILKADSMGLMQWTKQIGGSQADLGSSIEITPDGGYILGAISSSNDSFVSGHHGATTTKDFWIVKTDSIGNIQWEQSYGGSLDEKGYCSVLPTTDGGFIGNCETYSNDFDVLLNNGGADHWIIKLEGSVGINENTSLNENSVLVYPNPSSGKFHFSGVEKGSTIEICDISGRVIAKVFSPNTSCMIDLSESANGIYFYKVINGKQEIQAGKIILQ